MLQMTCSGAGMVVHMGGRAVYHNMLKRCLMHSIPGLIAVDHTAQCHWLESHYHLEKTLHQVPHNTVDNLLMFTCLFAL